MDITNGTASYRIGEMVADNGNYRLYLCEDAISRRQCLLQIASAPADNGGLDRTAYVLRELKVKADELEEEYTKVKKNPNYYLNYDIGFPELVDSFICKEQGGRRINILAFRNVESIRTLVPLSNLTERDGLRVDLRTSVWIMGKILKLLVFAHSEGFAVGLMTGRNILIEPTKHYVMMFDWGLAKTVTPGGLPIADRRKDIQEAARAVLVALDADPKGGIIPDTDDTNRAYAERLVQLAKGGESNAEIAHRQFYELADTLWPRTFYAFTTKSI